jgi:glycerophosphoryl diester phosphodiesterase
MTLAYPGSSRHSAAKRLDESASARNPARRWSTLQTSDVGHSDAVTAEFLQNHGPIAMAHMGFALSVPKNSMAAFAEATKLGFRYVETDVRATRDGITVILHDRKLDDQSGLPGAIDKLDWKDVRKATLGDGESIPTLEEVLGAWRHLRVNIDIKAASAIRPTVEVIERMNAHDRLLIASFSDFRRRSTLRLLSKPVATSAGVRVFSAFLAAKTIHSRSYANWALRDVGCLQLPPKLRGVPVITPRLVQAIHNTGRQVHAWTVNDPTEMRRLLDIKVDGIISDRADLLRDVLISRGEWPCA